MPRAIDADALTSVLEKWEEQACDGTENDGSDGTTRVLHPVPTTTREVIDLIADQPTIEAEPVKHGHWTIETDEHLDSVSGEIDEEFYLKCSECGRKVWGIDHMTVLHGTDEEIFGEYPYCHCGAKMDGERVALEEVVDIDAQTQRNNAAMRRVIDFVMDGGNDHD